MGTALAWRRLLSQGLVVALAATGVAVQPVRPAAAATTSTLTVPPIVSPRVVLGPASLPEGSAGVEQPTDPVVNPLPEPDEGPADGPATLTLDAGELVVPEVPVHLGYVDGQSVEVVAERGEFTKVYDNPDGSRSLKLFTGPVHVPRDGGWVDLDPALTEVGGLLSPGALPVDLTLSPTSGSQTLASVSDGEITVGFGLDGAANVPGVVSGDEVTYHDVWHKVDSRLISRPKGVKHELVLHGPDAPRTFRFPLRLDGVQPRLELGSGMVEYVDAGGVVRAITAAGFMEDANIDDHTGEGVFSSGVAYQLLDTPDGPVLEVTLDGAWLDDPARQYPVVVDPNVKIVTQADDTYMYSSASNYPSSDYLKIGTYNSGSTKARSFLHFPASGIKGKDVESAKLWLVNWHSWSCNARAMRIYRVDQDWSGYSSLSFPGPSTGARIATPSFAYGYEKGGCSDSWVGLDVTRAGQAWASGEWKDQGLMLMADSETNNYYWKKFYSYDAGSSVRPYVLVNYNRPPSLSTSPASGYTTHSPKFDISATASDKDGDTLSYRYLTATNSTMTSIVDDTGWVTNTKVQIKAETAADFNKTFYYQVHVTDGRLTTKSSVKSFKFINAKPSVTAKSPGAGADVHDLTPTLSISGSDADGDTVKYRYRVRSSAGTSLWETVWTTATSKTVPSGILGWNNTYTWQVDVLDQQPGWDGTTLTMSQTNNKVSRSFTTVNSAAPVPTPQNPGEDAIETELPVTFTSDPVTDPEGDAVSYQFQVTTGADGLSGRVATSRWLSSPTWTPPAGTFADGVSYYWVVRAQDALGFTSAWSTPRKFKVDLRLGVRAALPYDELGPATVNLASGNLVYSVAGPQFDTVGGPVGVSLTYNSATPTTFGLTGDYYQDLDQDNAIDAGEPRLLHRIDPQISFNWGSTSPHPGVIDPDWFTARWTGAIRVPAGEDGSWVLVADADNRVKVSVGGQTVLDGGLGTTVGSPVALSSISPSPIEVTFAEGTGSAKLHLKIRRDGEPDSAAFLVPADWLLPQAAALPGGWSRSGDGFSGVGYVQLRARDGENVVLVDASGADHAYTLTDGGWTPPKGETGILRELADGGWHLLAGDGYLYEFDVDGHLTAATAAADDTNPAAPSYRYASPAGGVPPRLVEITDATGRSIFLDYGPDGCPTATGLDPAAPTGMLCRVRYDGFDATATELLYSNGQLARIVNPGAALVDLGYDSQGRLTQIRDVLTNDLIAAGVFLDPTADSHKTLVGYDTGGRVQSVTAPVADASMGEFDRPRRSYTYATRHTDVHIRGMSPATGYARRATYDPTGRLTADTDGTGLTTTYSWDVDDRPVMSVGPDGLATTTVYDLLGRPTDSYGPAPAGWFNLDGTPNGTGTAPREQTVYDQGLAALAVAWFANPDLLGTPTRRDTAPPSGSWGAGAPAGLPADGFSGRFTGAVDLPSAGDYSFVAGSGQRARIFVDDRLVFDAWDGTVSPDHDGTITGLSAGLTRITIEYNHPSGDAALDVSWTPPGSTSQPLPASALTPGYGLVTTSTDADGHTVATGYDDPTLGLPTATTVDPAGLALTTTVAYEPKGTGFLRAVSKTLPSGATTTGYSYYGTGAVAATATNPCDPNAPAVHQGGGLYQRTGPHPGRVETQVHDAAGRIVAARLNDDPWRCTTYDSRGRVATHIAPDGKTTSHDYSDPTKVVTSYIDSAGIQRTTVETVDWIGRPVAYTDEHDTTTRIVYDTAGRAAAEHRSLLGATETLLVERTFDDAGRVTAIIDHLSGQARTTQFVYDNGRLIKSIRPDGSTSTSSYDATSGELSSLVHVDDGGVTLSDWTYAYTAAGRVQTEAGPDLSRAYAYDAAGRLVAVTDGTDVREYAYDANSNRCANGPVCDGSYTYDAADRILTSPYASDYTYDEHGNITSWTPTPAAQNDATRTEIHPITFEPTSTDTVETTVGRAGTLTATLTGESAGPALLTGSDGGQLPATSSTTEDLVQDEAGSYLTTQLSWDEGNRQTSTSKSATVAAGGTTTVTSITPTAEGPLTVGLDWQPTRVFERRSAHYNGALRDGDVSQSTHLIETTGNTLLSVTLDWPDHTLPVNLDLELYEMPSGILVASSASLTGSKETINYWVSGIAYGDSRYYQAKITGLGETDYDLDIWRPVIADLDLELRDPNGTVVAAATGITSKPETLTHTVGAAAVGTSFDVVAISRDFYASATADLTWPEAVHAQLAASLLAPDGTTIDTATGQAGSLDLRGYNPTSGTVQLKIDNQSTDLDVPSFAYAWTSAGMVTTTATGTLNPAGTLDVPVQVDAAGPSTVNVTWDKATTPRRASIQGTGKTRTETFEVPATGTIDATLDWTTPDKELDWTGTVSLKPVSQQINVTDNGYITASLRWGNAVNDLNLELLDPSGNVVAAETHYNPLEASHSLWYEVAGHTPGTVAAYKIRVSAVGAGDDFTVAASYPVVSDLDLKLLHNGTTVAQANTDSYSGPEQLTYTVPEGATGTYKLQISGNENADYTLNYSHPDYASLQIDLLDPTGAVIGTGTADTGSFDASWDIPTSGSHTLRITNTDPDLDAPGINATIDAPGDRYPIATLRIRDNAGNVLAAATARTNQPVVLAPTVTPGRHTIEIDTQRWTSTGRLDLDVPNPVLDPQITYDANDHATTISDGTRHIEETLSPDGRPIRRTVTDQITGETIEDVLLGYADGSDIVAYRTPAGSNTSTTMLHGPGGLLAIQTGPDKTQWMLADGRGNIIGRIDQDGNHTAIPPADEFGRPQSATDERLDWLGAHQRYRLGDTFGIIRMGVRLYDPNLGRFLQVDPVDGGSANNYEYCNADPINCLDLDGEFGFIKKALNVVKKAATNTWVQTAVVIAACSLTAGVGCAVASVAVAAINTAGACSAVGWGTKSCATTAAIEGAAALVKPLARAKPLRSSQVRALNKYGGTVLRATHRKTVASSSAYRRHLIGVVAKNTPYFGSISVGVGYANTYNPWARGPI